MNYDYSKDILIDPEALDVEWLNQPVLFLKYSNKASDARRELDESKEFLEYTKAEVETEIRTNPDKYGLEGKTGKAPTEAQFKNAVTLHERVVEAQANCITKAQEYAHWQNASNAFDQRKKALENLVFLHGQQYFAGPRVPRNLKEKQEEYEKTRKTAITESIKTAKVRRKKNDR